MSCSKQDEIFDRHGPDFSLGITVSKLVPTTHTFSYKGLHCFLFVFFGNFFFCFYLFILLSGFCIHLNHLPLARRICISGVKSVHRTTQSNKTITQPRDPGGVALRWEGPLGREPAPGGPSGGLNMSTLYHLLLHPRPNIFSKETDVHHQLHKAPFYQFLF